MSNPFFRVAGLTLLSLVLTGALAAHQDEAEEAPRRWRILVTNDDGIQSKALAELVSALAGHADVVVCAPDSNRSGSSQSVQAFGRPMTVKETAMPGASTAYAVGGSPADAVCYGVVALGADRPFDLVVSGINQGANVGEVSHYSGTVGAAMEGAYRGIPSIAVSQGGRWQDFSFSAHFTARFVEELRRRGARRGVVYSINVPTARAEDLAGVAVRPMGGSYIAVEGFTPPEGDGDVLSVRSNLRFHRDAPEGSDTAAFLESYVTVTPLRFDWTDRDALSDLLSWELSTD